MSLCMCVSPGYMSCVHRSTVHLYTNYIYKVLCVCVCPVYLGFLLKNDSG